MEVTMDQIKELRDETGVSVMQVKKALEEAKGDMDKARMALRKKSGEIAAKKGDRTLGAGVIAAYIHAGGSVGVLVELACETDFVAKNEDFKKLAYEIAMHIAAMNPKYNRLTDVTEEDRAKATAFFQDEVAKLDKPTAIKEKVLQGKLDTYFKEQTLVEQPFVKNPEVTVGDLVKGAVQKFGENTELVRFTRFVAGK
ncbi:MAG: elongation factor Ts [Candidatus Lloydbacteria bacterium RIFCSPHIGHO2_02_FULL_54_17]|uniref:Elongation factor Ts n=1 Tax=Candidatus Lloydbacteria bacterium RIFCSPHIGHO2_02_FULL_54_17 TaxID=1798664 RepID=A0A1G2DE00_9BACT|nr:MAG: elongation factor Ts [Candidatus Lloydbacteria bacterium RIFCSPHIGHO2_01_FULL_54_11]OGZ11849.1 MAG: elongation factor Ts [Candidatus Lloydbacteria bacterium RIFCSPHIGHO2_02_FULL_54_17]OGZ14130.1 MAG: elongation factor Ts [Candidatus Lloydbacteria bacterium RIFCSPLOWO2_01_FULL_54_18]OGZ16693.1 MAG: elongation factor Ts [Candidatus Lloydbacteria bacterium RIFCSPLOWO2_02_FULL_54_12]